MRASVSPMPESDVRGQILAAATRLFAQLGYEGASLQRIAEAVGIRKPSLLHYFPSKEALRRGVLEQMLSHWNERLPSVLLAASGGGPRFDAVMHEAVSFFLSDPDRARLVVREALDRPAEIRELLVSSVRRWIEAVSDYIRKGQRHGESFPDADPEAYVLHILRLVIVCIASAETFGAVLAPRAGQSALARQVRELVRIARASLFVPSPEPEARRARKRRKE
jgi:TetR/AcrR family transcriptional regulator